MTTHLSDTTEISSLLSTETGIEMIARQGSARDILAAAAYFSATWSTSNVQTRRDRAARQAAYLFGIASTRPGMERFAVNAERWECRI